MVNLLQLSVVFLGSVGGIAVSLSLFRLVRFATFHFVPFGDSLARYRRKGTKPWALVTGSSAGIGFGYAQELAARGFNVVILAHKADEVEEAAAQIRSENPDVEIMQIVLDATKASFTEIQAALKPVMSLPLTILVNNVAVQTSQPLFTPFSTYRPADIDSSIAANARFPCYVTNILYPTLKTHARSLIINMSSGGHHAGLPFLTTYSGTKAFNESWSVALSRESIYLNDRIDSLAIAPGDVHSQGNRHGVAPGSPQARDFAAMVLDRTGRAVSRGMKVMTPYWKHHVIIWAVKALPDSLTHDGIVQNIVARKTLREKAQ